MMDIYLEAGQKKVAGYSLEWPGWCRLARSREEAVQALLDYVLEGNIQRLSMFVGWQFQGICK